MISTRYFLNNFLDCHVFNMTILLFYLLRGYFDINCYLFQFGKFVAKFTHFYFCIQTKLKISEKISKEFLITAKFNDCRQHAKARKFRYDANTRNLYHKLLKLIR